MGFALSIAQAAVALRQIQMPARMAAPLASIMGVSGSANRTQAASAATAVCIRPVIEEKEVGK